MASAFSLRKHRHNRINELGTKNGKQRALEKIEGKGSFMTLVGIIAVFVIISLFFTMLGSSPEPESECQIDPEP